MDNARKRFFNMCPLLKIDIGCVVKCLLIIFLLCISAYANEVNRGQLLYENHCTTCHTPDIHQRLDRKVNSLVELNKRVVVWQHFLKLDWQLIDVRQVTNYLNQKFYNFPVRR